MTRTARSVTIQGNPLTAHPETVAKVLDAAAEGKGKKAVIDINAANKQISQSTRVDLTDITRLAEEVKKINARINEMNEEAKIHAARFKQITEELLPDLMAQANMSEFRLADGDIVKISDIVAGSIPSKTSIEECNDPIDKALLIDRRTKAIAWLKANNAEALIKYKLSAEFGKGQGEAADKFAKEIAEAGYEVKSDQSVHPSSLNKFLRETIEAGKDVPVDTFALFNGKRASITAPKAPRAKK